MSIRRLKSQRWRVLGFFYSDARRMQMVLTRKRYRKWYRQYLRRGPRIDYTELEDIVVQPSAVIDYPVCPGCRNHIDPDVCCCGDSIKNHHGEHNPVPMGCDCGRAR